MSAKHFSWIKASIPSGSRWYTQLHNEVVPFFHSAEVVSLCETWFYELNYRGGLWLDLYLYADASAIHTVLLPVLRQRFTKKHKTAGLPPLLQHNELLSVTRWDEGALANQGLLEANHQSTQLIISRQAVRDPGVQNCYDTLVAAWLPLLKTDADLATIAKIGYQTWLRDHFDNRYTIQQSDERSAQEIELTAFITQQPQLQARKVTRDLSAWIEATSCCADDSDATLGAITQAHILRYALAPYQQGSIWSSLFTLASTARDLALDTSEPLHQEHETNADTKA